MVLPQHPCAILSRMLSQGSSTPYHIAISQGISGMYRVYKSCAGHVAFPSACSRPGGWGFEWSMGGANGSGGRQRARGIPRGQGDTEGSGLGTCQLLSQLSIGQFLTAASTIATTPGLLAEFACTALCLHFGYCNLACSRVPLRSCHAVLVHMWRLRTQRRIWR